jgi:hypothetical protein
MPATHDATGRARKTSGSILVAPLATTSAPYIRRRNKIAGQFSPRLIEMLESAAYRALSLSAHRVLSRIEIELGHHAGRDNGRLPVTYEDFEAYGIDRHSIAPAINELEALGFIEVTERGRAGNAEFRSPNKFRLTFCPTGVRSGSAPAQGPTHEWRRIETFEVAASIANLARNSGRKTKTQCGKIPVSVGRTPTEKPALPLGESHTTPKVGNPTSLSIVWGGGEEEVGRGSGLETKLASETVEEKFNDEQENDELDRKSGSEMNKAKIITELENMVVARLFGRQPWLADRETCAAIIRKLIQLGLWEPISPSGWRITPLGKELDVDPFQCISGNDRGMGGSNCPGTVPPY